MSKLVYLFELDSTRRSPEEVRRGQAALFEELVCNGNCVVLTFNQLVDSPGLIETLRDDAGYQALLRLFAVGALKVSPYGNVRTASQYLQEASTNENFLFSALLLDRASAYDRELIELMGLSLRYGDLSDLDRMRRQAPDTPHRAKCEAVLRLVRLALQLNLESMSRNRLNLAPAFGFEDVVEVILEQRLVARCASAGTLGADEAERAQMLLEQVAANAAAEQVPGIRRQRSYWLARLRATGSGLDQLIAELAIDLCYNYAVEESIWGVAKHYRALGEESFARDFMYRLAAEAALERRGTHLFHSSGGAPGAQVTPGPVAVGAAAVRWRTVDWIMAALASSANTREAALAAREGEPPGTYEQTLRADHRTWTRIRRRTFVLRMATLVFYFVVFVVLNYGLGMINSVLAARQLRVLSGFEYSVLLFVLFAVAASAIMRLLRLPDILDSLIDVGRSIGGWVQVRRAPTGIAYVRPEEVR